MCSSTRGGTTRRTRWRSAHGQSRRCPVVKLIPTTGMDAKDMPLAKLPGTFIRALPANRARISAGDGPAVMAPVLSQTESGPDASVPGAKGQQDDRAVDFAAVRAIEDRIGANLHGHDLPPPGPSFGRWAVAAVALPAGGVRGDRR